jgi:hypothetical protein
LNLEDAMTPLWIHWAIYSAASLLAMLAIAHLLGRPEQNPRRHRPAPIWHYAACYGFAALSALAVAGEGALATARIAPAHTQALSQGKITALIYREGYSYDADGARQDVNGGWYIKVGENIPTTLTTTIVAFPPLGPGAEARHLPDTPSETMRASIKGLDEKPIQVCTGDCEGIGNIPDSAIRNTAGIVVADWARVQTSALGQPALAPVNGDALDPDPLPAGRWMLAIGLALALTAAGCVGIRKFTEARVISSQSRAARR